MRTKKPSLLLGVLTITMSSQIALGEVYQFYRGTRGLGMGGADTAVVNDETALLINPAALGKLRDHFGTVLDPEIDESEHVPIFYRRKSFSSFVNPEKVKAAADLERESHYHFREQLFPSFVMRNFGIGIYGKYSLDAEMNSAGTLMATNYTNDLALVMGYNFRFWDGRVKLGVNIKGINRVQEVGDLDPTTDLTPKTVAKEGVGYGTDVGIILTAPWTSLPTLSVVLRDAGSTKFTPPGYVVKGTVAPDALPQDADVAIAFFPIHDNRSRSAITFEYKNVITSKTATNKTQYYHFGYEYNMADLLFLRAGMNGKYYTYGAELASEHYQFQFASYGEEVGTSTATKEDRRIGLKMAIRY